MHHIGDDLQHNFNYFNSNQILHACMLYSINPFMYGYTCMFFIAGNYHQFDGAVLPEPKSWFGSKALKYLVRSQESPDKSLNYHQEKSMLHYLEEMKYILIACELSQSFSIHNLTEKTLHVFEQLFHSKVQMLKRNRDEKSPIHIRIAKQLPEVHLDEFR